MEKRYQVFISSTVQDLSLARQEVSQALLRTDCFPAGMELFPATNAEQFDFIKSMIKESDYYIVISAGWYGSIHPITGVSYTEMEYDYASEIGIPIIRLLHKNPFDELRGKNIEHDQLRRDKLEKFREKMSKSHLVRFWRDPKELSAEVVFGLMDVRKRFPKNGWVRGNDVVLKIEQDKLIERMQVLEYELSLEREKVIALQDEQVETLAQDNETVSIAYEATAHSKERERWGSSKYIFKNKEYCIEFTWQKICEILLPHLQNECDEGSLRVLMEDKIKDICKEKIINDAKLFKNVDYTYIHINIKRRCWAKILVQLRALLFIDVSIKDRGKRNQKGYWMLTNKGLQKLLKMAEKKK